MYVANLLLSQMSNPHMKLKICTLIWEKEHKCVWQVIMLEQSRLQSFKNVLTQHRMTTGTYMTHHHKPQFNGYYSQWGGELFEIPAMKVSQQNHWAISTEDLSPLVFILKLRWYLRERWVYKVECFRIFLLHSDVLLCTGTLVDTHIFHWQTDFLRAVGYI